jgi:hypothetical protein
LATFTINGVSGKASASSFVAYWNRVSEKNMFGLIRTHGSGDISASNSLNGRIEVVEGLALDYLSADLTAYTESGEASLNDEQAGRT